MKKKININPYSNNLADKPTEFLRLIGILCRKYSLSLYKINTINPEQRSFHVELIGYDNLFIIDFDYEYESLILESRHIYKYKEKDMISFTENLILKNHYKKGETVFDIYGNKKILEEEIDQLKRQNGICSFITKDENGDSTTISSLSISPF